MQSEDTRRSKPTKAKEEFSRPISQAMAVESQPEKLKTPVKTKLCQLPDVRTEGNH